MRQTIRLTESELREMIEMSINEAMQDEGVWDGLSAVKDKATNFLSRKGRDLRQNTKDLVSNSIEKAKDYGQKAKEYYNNKKEQVGQKVNNMKNTYYAGSINGEAQKCLKNACDSLEKLMSVNQQLTDKGFDAVLSKEQMNYINSVYKALSNKYAQAFNNMRDSYVNPSGQM